MKQITLLILVLHVFLGAKAQVNAELANDLQEILNNRVDLFNNNGVSAYVIMPGGETWTGTAGVGQDDEPIVANTVFHGASTTKLNVALLALLLQEEGTLDLDNSWNEYISLDVSFDPDITLRQLLNHSSGIADYLETSSSGATVTADFDFFFDPTYILEEIVSGTPDFEAGTDFNYSNSNYVLMGLVIEAVTGNQLHEELRARLWEPLGMTHTYFGGYEAFTEPSAGVWWNFGMGLTNYNDEATTSMLSFAYGAGNIVTTPSDLALLISEVMTGDFLSTASMAQLTDFVSDSFSSWTAGYGLGIHHQFGQTNDVVLGHDGYYTNLTDMFYSENYDFTLVTMTNTQTEWFGIFNPMYDRLVDYFESVTTVQEIISNELSISPNPSQGLFQVKGEALQRVEVFNLQGELVYVMSPVGGQNMVQIRLEDAGAFMVKATSKTATWTKRVIISK